MLVESISYTAFKRIGIVGGFVCKLVCLFLDFLNIYFNLNSVFMIFFISMVHKRFM